MRRIKIEGTACKMKNAFYIILTLACYLWAIYSDRNEYRAVMLECGEETDK
jgi:hypothetical protein